MTKKFKVIRLKKYLKKINRIWIHQNEVITLDCLGDWALSNFLGECQENSLDVTNPHWFKNKENCWETAATYFQIAVDCLGKKEVQARIGGNFMTKLKKKRIAHLGKENLYELIRIHKRTCKGDCSITLLCIRLWLEQLGVKFNKKEKLLFL